MPSRYLESTVLYIFGVKEKKEKNILSYLREREEESLIVIHSRSSRYTNIKDADVCIVKQGANKSIPLRKREKKRKCTMNRSSDS